MVLPGVGKERIAQRRIVERKQPPAAKIDAERLHHGADAAGICGMADSAGRRLRQPELLRDDTGKVRSR